ncbi:MAG: hypothetical protein J2P51_11615 [Hyphomicrobiaceae bacterium]|nr:hypothetical protein [Hyphomicrobiaceae bacterium]
MTIITAANLTNATSVSKRIAGAENARAALIMLADGEAPVGVVDQMDPAADPSVADIGVFVNRTHPPIISPTAATAGALYLDAAAFPVYVPSAKAGVEAQGFTVLNQGRS